MAELHGILEPDFLQTAEGNCKVLVSLIQKKNYMTVDMVYMHVWPQMYSCKKIIFWRNIGLGSTVSSYY